MSINKKNIFNKIFGTFCTGAIALSMLHATPGSASIDGDNVTLTIKNSIGSIIGTHSNIVDTSAGSIDFKDGPSFLTLAPHLKSNSGADLDVEIDFQPALLFGHDGRIVISYSGGIANDTIDTHSFIFTDMQWVDSNPPMSAVTTLSLVGALPGSGSSIDNGDASGFSGGFNRINLSFFDDPAGVSGSVFNLNGAGKGGFIVEYTATHVPEPSTYLLLGSMIVVAAVAKSKKKKVA